MKLEIGMYIRTKSGIIDKIIDIKYNDNYNIDPAFILLEKNEGYVEFKEQNTREENGILIIDDDIKTYWFFANEIKKFHYDITKLIEKDDFILGKDGKIYQCWKVYKGYVFTYSKNKQGQTITLVDYQFDSILTKEQFNQKCYKVGE